MSESTMPVIVTLFESYGSGAEELGPRIAEALGVPYHEQAFSSEQLEAQEEERERESVLSRVVVAMGFGSANEGSDVPLAQQDKETLRTENTRQVVEWAEQGGVIVGRNGAFILSQYANALHVRLDGPLETRLARAAAARGISEERAAKRQQREDRVRVEMSQSFYGWDPRDDTRYDLMLNTGTLSDETCVEIIVAASRAKAVQGAAGQAGRAAATG